MAVTVIQCLYSGFHLFLKNSCHIYYYFSEDNVCFFLCFYNFVFGFQNFMERSPNVGFCV